MGFSCFIFAFLLFFCCFWAYCRPLLLLLISFCCFWTCCRALIASFYCWILLLLFIVAPPQSHLQLTILTMIIKCGIIKLAHKYKWKLRSVSLKISVFYCRAANPVDFAADLWYNKMGFIFFLKKFFVAHSFTSSICLTKLCQDGYSSYQFRSSYEKSQLTCIYSSLTCIYSSHTWQLTYLTRCRGQ